MASETRRKKSPILDMLSTEGQATRPLASRSEALPANADSTVNAAEPSASISEPAESSAEAPSRSAPPAPRPAQPEAELARAGGVTPASATVRAKSHAVADLRQAWLEAKASDLMLSYTDYATRVIEEGLRSMRRAR